MNVIATQIIDATAITAPFKVDPFKGGNNGEVSRQWAARPRDQRFLSLGDMHAHLKQRAETTQALVLPSKKVEFIAPEARKIEDTNKLALALPNGDLVGPTHWSFGQLAGLADFSARELRKLPTQLGSDVLNYMFQRRETEDVKLFYSEDMGAGSLRAAVGPKYGWIRDADVVEALQTIAGNGTGDTRWKIPGVIDWQTHYYDPMAPVTIDSTTLYASDRDMFAFLVDDTHPIEVGTLKDGSPDLMFRGFYISNSEVGAGSMRLAAFYLRAVCMNRNLWGVEHFDELVIRHTSQAPARFLEEARPALSSFAEGSEKTLREGVAKAKTAVLAKEEDEALSFLRGRGFSAKRAAAIMLNDAETGAQREDGDFPTTAWDFAQAITAEARNEPNSDSRLAMEMEAKKILDKVAA